MRVFKQCYHGKEGQNRETSNWYVEFRDHLNITRRIPAFTDERASEGFGQKVEELVSCRIARMEPSASLSEWILSLPTTTRDRLAKWSLIDKRRLSAGIPLSDQIKEWGNSLNAKGNTEQHVHVRTSRVEKVFEACGFKHWNDIRPEPVEAHLEVLRQGKDGISALTSNLYLQAIKSFCTWMVKRGRAVSSPVITLAPLKRSALVKDARHKRRAFSIKEITDLLTKTQTCVTRFGMSGKERTLLYLLAVETGLRSSELASLTKKSFNLEAKPAFVEADAGSTKNAQTAQLPLKEATAALLRQHIDEMKSTDKVFKMPPKWDVIHMMKADLTDAGITYVDEEKRHADFHALRHTFCSNLAASGVHPKVAQELARHSDINLTLSYYTHTVLEQRHEAIAKLPTIIGTNINDAGDNQALRKHRDETPAGEKRAYRPAYRNEADSGVSQKDSDGRFSQEEWSHLWDLNPGPMLYESIALPLS